MGKPKKVPFSYVSIDEEKNCLLVNTSNCMQKLAHERDMVQ